MRQFLTIFAALICTVALAQKPSINKAKAALDKGKLGEAKTIIDQATTYEKTMGKAKTWYYRGMIYMALDTTTNEPGAMETAIESFNKALEIDPQQKSINEFTGTGVENVDSKIQNYYNYFYNKAVQSYETEEFEIAAENFENAGYVMPVDTNAIVNAGFASAAAGDDERAKKNYELAIEKGMKDRSLFLRLYNYAIKDDDLDKAYAILESAKEIYPADVDIQKYRINILIQQDKIDEAKAGIEKAIASEPDNPDLHFSLGVIREEQENLEGARESYMNAIKSDDSHYNSNFNLGVMVFNECNSLIKERNALNYKEEKKYNELTKLINERLTDALPYWEKLYELNNQDEKVLETLKYIYANLKMNDKALKIADEIDALKG